MLTIDRWVDNKIVQNLCIWLALFLILLASFQGESRVLAAISAVLLLAPAVYVNNLLILPFFKERKLVFFSLFIVNTILFSVISVGLINLATDQELVWTRFLNFVSIMLLALIFASAVKIARDSFTRRQQEKDAELKLLQAQLNPHFLFNTLNNLYGLSVVKSDKLPELMLKLSDLLRYSLYETKETLVSLEREIEYLENYMSLEKIRLEDSTDIEFNKEGDVSSLKIAPMLFIVFVENAFKHLGVVEHTKSRVAVSVKVANDRLIFSCENTVDPLENTFENLEEGKSGIGLQNVKKRLELIYPEKHVLRFRESDTKYTVELILDI